MEQREEQERHAALNPPRPVALSVYKVHTRQPKSKSSNKGKEEEEEAVLVSEDSADSVNEKRREQRREGRG
jgi:hypothetical protein